MVGGHHTAVRACINGVLKSVRDWPAPLWLPLPTCDPTRYGLITLEVFGYVLFVKPRPHATGAGGRTASSTGGLCFKPGVVSKKETTGMTALN